MRKLLDKLRRLSALPAAIVGAFDLRDVFTLGGLALIGYGLYIIYPPAAFIVVGSLVFWIGAH